MGRDLDHAAVALQRGFFGEKERVALRYARADARACFATTPASRRSACRTRAAISSCCPIWARSSGARSSTASNSPCRACSANRARPRSSSRPMAASPITPGCCATACRRRRTRISCMAKCPAPRWTRRASPAAPTSAAPGSPSPARANMRWASARIISRRRASSCAPTRRDFDVVMEVENLSAAPMDLMYLCHVNFAFAEGGAHRAIGSVHARACRHAHRDPRPCHAERRLSRAARRPRRQSGAHGEF